MKICPNCGRENADDASFCSGCGTKLDDTASREERKVVTVLFCDLVGSTAQAERLDPEDVRAMLSRYHEHVRRELERHGGTVEKFIGDAVMALLGAPVAHEDDPERAVRAALAIRDWAADEQDLQVRIGITTGEALVSLGARAEIGESMAAGDVVNSAARLQSAASENGILVDEPTFRATERAIVYDAVPAVEAKGKARPIPAWKPVEARARFGVDVRHIARAPLVGRVEELKTLTAALGRVKREREPQLITLVGVPGIGKSRLVWELFRSVSEERELVYWRQGRSLPYGEGIALWGLGEMVKAHAGVLESDSADDAASKVDRVVRDLVDDDPDWVIRHVLPLIGARVPEELADRRTEAFAAWRRFFEAVAETRPLVLVFEDLHWADDQLLDFVDYLAEWTSTVPLLVVCTARPELLDRRPDWSGGKTNAATLRLLPLTDGETAQLLHALLKRPVLSADAQATLLAKSSGNPLYAEEFVRLLAARESVETLPESVQGIIAARLDGLPRDEKAVLQDGAVLGKVFWIGALAAIGGGNGDFEHLLHALERKDFVRRERRSSVGGEHEYAFRHALVRDVAYSQIPRRARVDKHRRAAEWVEALGRRDDHADLLAHHYVAALKLARAMGLERRGLEEKARLALRDAGDRAASLGSFTVAAHFYREALTLYPEQDGDRARLLLKLGTALRFSTATEAAEQLRAASRALESVGDLEGVVEAEATLGELAFESLGAASALEHLDVAVAKARELEPSRAKAHALSGLGRVLMFTDRVDESVDVGSEALRMAERLGLEDLRVQALLNVGTARTRSGDEDGIADIRRSIEIGVAAKTPECLRAYWNLSVTLYTRGELAEASVTAAEGLRLAEAFGARSFKVLFMISDITERLDAGDWDEALRRWELVAQSADPGDTTIESNRFTIESVTAAARGELELATRTAADGLAHAHQIRPDDPDTVGVPRVVYAWVLVEASRRYEARAVAVEIAASPEPLRPPNMLPWLALVFSDLGLEESLAEAMDEAEPTIWTEIAERCLKGDHTAAADCCAQNRLLFLEALMRLHAASSFVEQGRRADADAQLEQALPFFRSIDAKHFVRKGESLLAATA
jgi:class 3 adenylate cyclase/tetratricopeptide (TPR) repeat protein